MHEYYHSLIRGERGGWTAGLQRAGLRFLSIPYSLAVMLRNLGYDRGWKKVHRAAVPVISVGNLTVGGTGKTPCVELIARWLREHDYRVAILSRGYGSDDGRNDEAMVLEENLPNVPHLQDINRVELARIAVEELESEVLVLDDGFQHRRLARDLDVVLVDATDPWGCGGLLPAGLLREPLRSLKRAGLIVLTRADQVSATQLEAIESQLRRFARTTPIVQTVHRPLKLVGVDGTEANLEMIRGFPIVAFCGIGNPTAFEQTLRTLGSDVVAFRTFADHHRYTREDIEDLRRWVRQQATNCLVVTTQKDLVKVRLSQVGDRPLWALQIQMAVIKGQDLLDQKLKEVMR